MSTYPDVDVRKTAFTVVKKLLSCLSETNIRLAFLDERLTQAVKENLPKNLKNHTGKKNEMELLVGKNLVFEGKDWSHFVPNK